MTAAPERVVYPGAPIVKPPDIYTETGWAQIETVMRTTARLEPCKWCSLEGHVVRWRLWPHAGEFPAPGVLDDEIEGCHCCIWGRGGVEGLVARAERESVDDRDIQVEHLTRDGRWVAFERRF